MIKFNDKESAQERAKTRPLTLSQELEVVKIINQRLHGIDKQDLKKLQRFFNHYQNLCHFKAVHTGMWATEEKPFQIK